MRRVVRRWRAAALACVLLGSLAGCSAGSAADTAGAGGDGRDACPAGNAGDDRYRELRGIWIATARNIDWPPRPGLPAAQQKAAYRALLDSARRINANAVFVQIRPTADAFYPSRYEPWSQWLTGRQGGDPGYDPLRFLIAEAHARGLEFHAWFNPYRVGATTDVKKLAPRHPARLNPGLVRQFGKGLWYDPGLPAVRDLTKKVVLDVVDRYDIDGVHFDDYFYPYPVAGQRFNDDASFKQYGSGFRSRADWRRANVNTLVGQVSGEIHRAKPWVRFGISPFGVWRNASTDPAGSRTRALQSYDDIYADTRTWMTKGWLDYVVPQLYWSIGYGPADYRELAGWWSRLAARTKVQLYTGQAAYRVGQAQFKDPAELSRHVRLDHGHKEIRGQVYFSAKSVTGNARGFADRLRADHYGRPALIPELPRRRGKAPLPVSAVRAEPAEGKARGVRLSWKGSSAAAYAIYRLDGRAAPCAPVDGRQLLATRPGGGKAEFTDATAQAGRTYTYVVTALDRLHAQSRPSKGVSVTASKG